MQIVSSLEAICFFKIGFDISCKLSPLETIRIKCPSLFSRKIQNLQSETNIGAVGGKEDSVSL